MSNAHTVLCSSSTLLFSPFPFWICTLAALDGVLPLQRGNGPSELDRLWESHPNLARQSRVAKIQPPQPLGYSWHYSALHARYSKSWGWRDKLSAGLELFRLPNLDTTTLKCGLPVLRKSAQKLKCPFFDFFFVSARRSCASRRWWYCTRGCAPEMLSKEDQRAHVAFRPPSSFTTRLQPVSPSLSPHLSLCLLWSHSGFTSHPLASCFSYFSMRALSVCRAYVPWLPTFCLFPPT